MKSLKTLAIAALAFAGTSLFAGEVTVNTNMTCGSCEAKISQTLDKTEGVDEYTVDLAANTVMIKYDDSKTNEADVTKTIADLGFKAETTEMKTVSGEKKSCGTKKACCTTKDKKAAK